jgi:hypothetical protein
MRRSLWVAGVLCLLLLAYFLWPVMGFYRLAAAIEAKDSDALADLVDFPALRKSLTKQLVHAYLEITGKRREKKKQPKLSLIERTVAIGMGTSIAEPIVAEIVNEKTLMELLTKGRLGLKGGGGGGGGGGADAGPDLSQLAPFSKGSAPSVWQIWSSTEYRGNDVYAYLPPDKPRGEQFRVKFTLSGLEWKLSGIQLPEPMIMQFAKELAAQQKAKEKKGE